MALSPENKRLIDHQFYDIVDPGNVFWATKALENMEVHLRGMSGGPASITYAGQATEDAQNYWNKIAGERLLQLQNKLQSAADRRLLRRNLAERRLLDAQPVDHQAMYRKMSLGEWKAIFADWKHETPQKGRYVHNDDRKLIRFKAAFEYTNTDNYRLWFSTSLMKCRKFENMNASQSDDVIMRFWFKPSPKERFAQTTMLPHKQRGVQNNPDVVAWHREEFAEEDPSISSTAIMKERLGLPTSGTAEEKRHYNLGFTSKQQPWMHANCVSAEPMFP